MREGLHEWVPCLADRYRGVAFFDGVTIEADPIVYPLKDRVLPVLAEEQVQMCRLMLREGGPLGRLPTGSLCLDLGTGSGVFAIAAAKAGCRVVAVDCNPRALRFAQWNAAKGAVTTRLLPEISIERINDVLPGEVGLLNGVVDSAFATLAQQWFDAVFLSPPYNPTFPEIDPAVHAEAGERGQDEFLKQVALVPSLLKDGGFCIGNQMGFDEKRGEFSVLKTIQAVFSSRFGSLSFAHLLADNPQWEAREFLTQQYRDIRRNSELREAFEGYLQRCDEGLFSLLYYELQVAIGDRLLEQEREVEELETARPPGVTWADRIGLHREIVNNAADSLRLRAPAFFVSASSTPRLPPTFEESGSPWRVSVLRALHSWMLENDLVGGEETPFELMVIDTAPYYMMVRPDHLQECAAWATGGDDGYRRRVVEQWQRHTMAMQQTDRGIFLHAAFTGSVARGKWREILSSLRESTDSEVPEGIEKDCFEKVYLRPVQERFLALARAPVEIPSTAEEGGSVGYSTKRLKDLVPRKPGDLPTAEDLMLEDLEHRHWAMHVSLDKGIEAVGERDQAFTSVLMSLPVAVGYTPEGSFGPVPETYRGGIWIYARSRECLGPRHLERLRDLGRVTWLLYNAKYSFDATRAAERRWQGRGARLLARYIGLRKASERRGELIDEWIHGAPTAINSELQGTAEKAEKDLAALVRDRLGETLDWFTMEDGSVDEDSFKHVFAVYGGEHAEMYSGPVSTTVLERACSWVQFEFAVKNETIQLPFSPGVMSLFHLIEFLWEWHQNYVSAGATYQEVKVEQLETGGFRMIVPMIDPSAFFKVYVSGQGGSTCRSLRRLITCKTDEALASVGRGWEEWAVRWPRVERSGSGRARVVFLPEFTDDALELTWSQPTVNKAEGNK